MKKPFVALLLMIAAAAMVASNAFAQIDEPGDLGNKLVNAKKAEGVRGSRLGASIGALPDSVYVGKSFTDHRVWPGLPGVGQPIGNYWNLYVGNYNLTAATGGTDPNNSLWGWDKSVAPEPSADSLNGWWPLHLQYVITSGTQAGTDRPWMGIDHGNVLNYVLSQPGAPRTFGIVGMWHADPGGPANGVTWSPLGTGNSAWCGLRRHGDNSVVDQVTKNPFNQDVQAMFGAAPATNGSNNGFPGYTDQIDQILYRDIPVTSTQSLTVNFKYRTRMATDIGTNPATRTGWFHGDPLRTAEQVTGAVLGNFISSSAAGANAPADSFMVYVGSPVDDAACVRSDGSTAAVYDVQRRWFSEVVKVFRIVVGGPLAGTTELAPLYEIFARAGNDPPLVTDPTPESNAGLVVSVSAAQVATLIAPALSGNVRLAFRVKTNRGFSDADTRASLYSSGGQGAVVIDDVTYSLNGGAPVTFGDFNLAEQGGAGSIDNRFGGGITSATNWRSTGKPPGENWHLEGVDGLTYEDLCGAWDSPNRQCNINGLIMTPGNHDRGERSADDRYDAFREVQDAIVSPTINLVPGAGLGGANDQGITPAIADATDDIMIWYDLYAGMFNLSFTGNGWVFGSQSYPATQLDGTKIWGQLRFPGFQVFNPEPQCFTDWEPFNGNGTPLVTSNVGMPDSLRIFMSHNQQCFRFGVLGAKCNSAAGAYFDNISVAFVDVPGVAGLASSGTALVNIGSVTSDIWQFTNDTFPETKTVDPATPAYFLATAITKSGLNISQATGLTRFNIPGDTSAIIGANGTTTAGAASDGFARMDYVFRVLPGPGNYDITTGTANMTPGAGQPSLTGPATENVLLNTPGGVPVAPGDGSFWSTLISNPRGDLFAEAAGVMSNNHNGRGAGTVAFAKSWDPLTWNAVRMDTTEVNIFKSLLVGNGIAVTQAGVNWMTMAHESDFLRSGAVAGGYLGTRHTRCWLVNPAAIATTTANAGANNVDCTLTNTHGGLWPALNAGSGWDNAEVTAGGATEYTKIIPDNLLTPGSHVQYFYRKSTVASGPTPTGGVATLATQYTPFVTCPDTNLITPQNREGSTDQHRWQEFSVLPDAWKHGNFGGGGMACILLIDNNDRRGNEGRFVAVMDSIGGTAAVKRGAHNGWTAPGTTNIAGLDVRTDMSVAVSNQDAQPGTIWDMYGVKASESVSTGVASIGTRLAPQAPGVAQIVGRDSKQGPTPLALKTFYRVLIHLTGDLTSGVMGPYFNRTSDDVAILTDFLLVGGVQPRGYFIQGDGAHQSSLELGQTLFSSVMGIKIPAVGPFLSYGSYNPGGCADIRTTPDLNNETPTSGVYGVTNGCTFSNDLGDIIPAFPRGGMVIGGYYEDVVPTFPHNSFHSEIIHQANAAPGGNFVSAWSGYDIEHLFSRYCDTGSGRLAYYYHMLPQVFAAQTCAFSGAPSFTLDTPNGSRGYASFMKIGNSVMRQGLSLVRINQAKPGRVQVSIYDVAGRKIRNLADRVFPAGETPIQWDGTDDGGTKVGRGVYFVRTSVQKGSGRIIVLSN